MLPRRPRAARLVLTAVVFLASTLTGLGCKRPTADLEAAAPSDGPKLSAPERQGEDDPRDTGPRWVDLSIEQEFGCAVERTGSVYCWGRGPAANMKLRELPPPGTPAPPVNRYMSDIKWGPPSRLRFIDDATAVSTATSRACAIVEDGRVRCWGAPRWGGQHVYDIPGLTGAVELAVGDTESCAALPGGELWCWGDAEYGLPRLRMEGAVAMAVDDNIACGLSQRGQVRCWGRTIEDWHRYAEQFSRTQPASGAPPLTTAEDFPDSFDVGRFPKAAGLELTSYHKLCLLNSDGRVACVVEDLFSVLRGEQLSLRELGEEGVVELVSSHDHTCARKVDDRVHCWGDNTYGQLGDGSSTLREDPGPPVKGVEDALAVSVTQNLSCAATRGDEILCWGFDSSEGLGRDIHHIHTVDSLKASSLAASGRSTCVVDQRGQLQCWGSDMVEQVGITLAAAPQPLDLPIGTELRGMLASWNLCVLGSSGKLSCGSWQLNGPGQPPSFDVSLSLDNTQALTSTMSPTCVIAGRGRRGTLRCGADFSQFKAVGELRGVKAVSAANMRVCVVQGGGRVSCFGEMSYYGDRSPPPREIVAVRSVQKARALASSNNTDCALQANGRVRCWGARVETQWSGDGRTLLAASYKSDNARDIELSDVVQISGAGTRTCALDSGGNVRCWQDAPYEQETQWLELPELPADLVELALGQDHACVRGRDGRVTCWGEDNHGQLGALPSRVYLEATALKID